jgi:hypothetical protein
LVGGKVGVFAKGWLDNGVVRVVVELDDVGPVVIGKVGDLRELLGVMVKIAKYEDGVLHVNIPKVPGEVVTEKSKLIEIK